MNKEKAMLKINKLIKKYNITHTDFYYAYPQVENPTALMLGCDRCDEFENNGCGIMCFPQIDAHGNDCDHGWKTLKDFYK